MTVPRCDVLLGPNGTTTVPATTVITSPALDSVIESGITSMETFVAPVTQYISVSAAMITMVWKASDRDQADSRYHAAHFQSTLSPSNSAQGMPKSTDTVQYSHSLSIGTKIAIGVGVSLSTIFLLILSAYVLLRQRRRQNRSALGQGYDKPELSASAAVLYTNVDGEPVELSALGGVREIGEGLPHELVAPKVTHELANVKRHSVYDNSHLEIGNVSSRLPKQP
jgi:hypothetical protein